jgi:L-threonylcarbamoyladenylate synthase
MKISLEKAIQLLKSEKIVGLPTETVYGLASRFDSEKAIRRIFETKERPLNHPLIIHIAEIDWLYQLAKDINPYVTQLINRFWPGPLTLVLKKKLIVSDMVTASQDTVAIRIPDHPLMRDVIKKVGVPLVAPSANIFCKTSPTTADHVENNFQSSIPVLDGGKCKVGIESTIILATENDSLTLLRPGILSKRQITEVSKIRFRSDNYSNISVPGQKKIHYQPNVSIVAFEKGDSNFHKAIGRKKERYIVVSLHTNIPYNNHEIIAMPDDPIDYSQLMYESWHNVSLDEFDKILIELPPNEDRWQGVRDRIIKASSF